MQQEPHRPRQTAAHTAADGTIHEATGTATAATAAGTASQAPAHRQDTNRTHPVVACLRSDARAQEAQ